MLKFRTPPFMLVIVFPSTSTVVPLIATLWVPFVSTVGAFVFTIVELLTSVSEVPSIDVLSLFTQTSLSPLVSTFSSAKISITLECK